DGIRDPLVTGVQTCALPISSTSTRHPTAVPPSAYDCHSPPGTNPDDFAPRKPRLGGAILEARRPSRCFGGRERGVLASEDDRGRSEEHTSELQSRVDLVCRL